MKAGARSSTVSKVKIKIYDQEEQIRRDLIKFS
jgi:hypothetical protein